MKIGRRKLIAAALGALAIALAVVGWYLGGTDALLAIVLVTVLIGGGLIANAIAQTERRLRSASQREIQRASSASLKAVLERVDRHSGQLRKELKGDVGRSMAHLEEAVMAEIARRLQRPSEQAEALLRAIRAGYLRLEEEQKVGNDRLRSAIREQSVLHNHAPAEIDALLQVHRRLKLEDPLPLMGGWALSPRGMLQAIELAGEPHVSLVVECGSGTSTLFIARALQLQGQGEKRVVALEHLPEFLELTQEMIEAHDLGHIAEVRYAPLEEVKVEGEPYSWYTTTAVEDLSGIDLLLVDGPPGSAAESARYPAYPLLQEKLSPSAVILVDDIGRRDEREMVDRWVEGGRLTEHHALGRKQVLLRVKPGNHDLSESVEG